jgi:hypothetical protein
LTLRDHEGISAVPNKTKRVTIDRTTLYEGREDVSWVRNGQRTSRTLHLSSRRHPPTVTLWKNFEQVNKFVVSTVDFIRYHGVNGKNFFSFEARK